MLESNLNVVPFSYINQYYIHDVDEAVFNDVSSKATYVLGTSYLLVVRLSLKNGFASGLSSVAKLIYFAFMLLFI